jgi:hypothetical protein
MMRPLIALLVRSLREDARLRSTYVLRGLLVAMVLFYLAISHSTSTWSRAVGLDFFRQVMWIDLFILCIVGLTYFASSITEEKEDDTLGLLRMTGLSPLAILLGKSTARLVNTLLLIGAQLPFMLLAVTMGGLAVGQVLAGFVMLLGFTFFLANLGLLWSVIADRTSGAAVGTGSSVVAFVFLPFWILHGAAVSIAAPRDDLERFFIGWIDATPTMRLANILSTGFNGPIFGWYFWVNLVLGVLCFGVAWLLFDRCSDAPETSSDGPALALPAPAPGSPAQVLTHNGRAQIPAIPWKDYHFISFGIGGIVVKALVTVLLSLSAVSVFEPSRFSGGMGPVGGAIFFLNGGFLLFCLSVDAGRIFKLERRDRTLSALLGLPHSTISIVWQKVRGCVVNSWPPLAGLLLGAVLSAPSVLREMTTSVWNAEVVFYLFCAVLSAVSSALLLPVVIARLSLSLRWGAFPIGIACWGVGNLFLGMLSAAMFPQGAAVVFPFVVISLLGVLASSIPATLERAAGEG